MATCAKCRLPLTDGSSFCGSCGARVGEVAEAPPAAAAPETAAPAGDMAPNVAGLLTYVFGLVTGVIFLVLEPYRRERFVRFHAFQSIFFSLAWIAFLVASNVLWVMLSAMTHGTLAFVLLPLHLLITFAVLGYWVLLMYKAFKNERYIVPFIGPIAARHAG